MATSIRLRRLGATAATFAVAASGAYITLQDPSVSANDRAGGNALEILRSKIADPLAVIPSRAVQESTLIGSSPVNPVDILVIGGGATGCGVALDAATRGLRVGLVERDDFSSGTSSRSTKLIHGGVRYLEKAVFNLDYGQLKLVFHALEERKQAIENAPHLCHALPCMTPCFDWFEVIYFWMGLKLYDLVAGRCLLHLSRYYSAQESVELFPTLARKGKDKSLKGTVVYYDGQMNDSRLNVGLACTAALAGAAVLNHAEVVSFLREEVGERIIGARIRDNLSGQEFDTYAKVVVNAAGPFCDSVRKMADKEAKPMICPSSGVHIVLPDYYSPEGMGLIVPKTKDGRVVFMLPWLGRTVAGTTDSNTSITMLPEPHEDEIQFILDAICDYLNVKNENLGKRLAHGYPFLEAEVAYCARNEYCESAVDFIARRSRLAFLDTDAAGRALPRIIEILSAEHKWVKSRQQQEVKKAKEFLETFKSAKNAQFHDGKHQ